MIHVRPFSYSACIVLALSLSACSQQGDDPAARKANLQTGEPTHLRIAQGELVGLVQDNGSHAWLGIPYAEAPVAERRWKVAEPHQGWEGVFKAQNDIQPCPQFASNLTDGVEDPDGDGIVGTEDCLHLSVYAPADASPEKPLPVMYWIYGGGNNSGYAGDYDGGNLAQAQDVIVVTVNYRLGSLGWFIHPAIIPEGASGADASGNWSTVDTIRGLEWVRDNIAAFGGDPDNVTIFGESAGGANVMSLVTSPMAKGLFHKAIVESGGLETTPMAEAINYRDADPAGHVHSSKEIVNAILLRDNEAANREEAIGLQETMPASAIRELLYSQSAADFLKLYNPEGARNYPAPKKFRDGTVFVKTPPMEQLAAGDYNHVPIILGTNRDERRIYMYRDPRWAPLIKSDPEEYIRVAKYPSDAWKLRGVDELARAMAPVQEENVFAFRFDWDEGAVYQGLDLAVGIGAGHSVEMAFIFGDWNVGFVPKDVMYDPARNESRNALSRSMMSYWANFAYTGDPGKGRDGREVQWQPWQGDDGKAKMLVLDTPQDGGIRMSTDQVTAESIKSEFLADQFSSQDNLCYTYRATFERMGEFDAEEYAELGCTD
ncbi:carboxylesterase family protein [Proteobacteria bacterium 005FR1]|nr:carboxylesterase family protein [Proteobacteria bacterium 005FR1]